MNQVAAALVSVLLFTSPAIASKLRITRVGAVTPEAGQNGQWIDFDISWRDSWRNEKNWDAAWIFVKHRAMVYDSDKTFDQIAFSESPSKQAQIYRHVLNNPDRYVGEHITVTNTGDPSPGSSAWHIRSKELMGAAGRSYYVERSWTVVSSNETDATVFANELGSWSHTRIVGAEQALSQRTCQRGHETAQGTLKISDDGAGVFLYQSSPPTFRRLGTTSQNQDICFAGVRLLLADSEPGHEPMDVWIHAIEMVYVPQGGFEVGDPLCEPEAGPDGCFFDPANGGGPVRITDEDEDIVVGRAQTDRLAYKNDTGYGSTGDGLGPIPSAFPKGVSPFYMMKYELSAGQYALFINSLVGPQKTLRFPYGGQGAYRFAIHWGRPRERVAMRPERAVNWLSWKDASAFLDWAALRPMTELEFEKAARGNARPVASEYAWGTSSIYPATIIVGDEAGNVQTNGNANVGEVTFVGGDGGQGPLSGNAFVVYEGDEFEAIQSSAQARFIFDNGAWTKDVQDHREIEGRSAYGALHLTGNIWEFAVSIGSEKGRGFYGCHGDGKITDQAEADVPGWPDPDTADGIGFRGGAWYADEELGVIANRRYANFSYTTRSHDAGARGVRNAPGNPDDPRCPLPEPPAPLTSVRQQRQ